MSPCQHPESVKPIASLENVSVEYRRGSNTMRALRGVDLEVPTGDFLAIEGPSGSGKSTLLRVLAGLWPASSGSVFIDGVLLSTLAESDLAAIRRRKIGFVHQLFNLLPDLSVEQNVALPLLIDGIRDNEATSRARAVCEQLAIGDTRSRFPEELSGGEMLRVALARALVIRPVLLLADEPTGSLDQRNSRAVVELFRDLHYTEGTTVVLVTHDSDVASGADRRIRLIDGRIVSDTIG